MSNPLSNLATSLKPGTPVPDDLGFVNRLGTLADARVWAAELATRAPLTVAAHKLALNRLEPVLADNDVVAAVNQAWTSSDLQEGRAAFAEKRTPNFTGE
jgi:enoyl-CoA hydratase